MPIVPSDQPLRTVDASGNPAKKVLVYVDGANYADSFGYEWTRFQRTYSDSALGGNLSRARLELNLGFPLEFLRGMDAIEIGCGAGRFTEHLVRHAREVVAVDYSEAVFHNAALGAPNLVALRADILDMPKFAQGFDLVFCRGVLQHTRDPKAAMHALFRLAKPGGLVIFDVYRKNPRAWRSFKYFFRPFFRRFVPLERFDAYVEKHADRLYRLHHAWLKTCDRVPGLRWLMGHTPLYLGMDWESEYGMLARAQRVEIFKNELIDMLYAHYDQPMSPREVIQAMAEIGQIPYSYDTQRNHFRARRSEDMRPIRVRLTKNGVFAVEPKA